MRNTISEVKRNVSTTAGKVVSGVKNTVSSAMASAGKVVDTVKSSFSDAGKTIQSTAVTVGQAVTSAVSQVTEAVTKAKAVAAENVEKIHTGLDVAGFVPVYGEVADAANALIYLAQGDISNAAISGAAFVPVIGSAGTGTRLAAKGIGAVADASAAAKGMKAAGAVTDGVRAAEQVKDAEKVASGAVKGTSKTVFNSGKISVEAIESNPDVFSGKSVNEIADMLKAQGYDITIQASTKSRSGAQIIKINNPGVGKNISQVQVSPGGGRHGANPYVKISTTDQGTIKVVDGVESTYKTDGTETAKIIFAGGK